MVVSLGGQWSLRLKVKKTQNGFSLKVKER